MYQPICDVYTLALYLWSEGGSTWAGSKINHKYWTWEMSKKALAYYIMVFCLYNMFYSHLLSRLGVYHKEADSIAENALKSYSFIFTNTPAY